MPQSSFALARSLIATKEMILGVLKARDETKRGIIHSSDFRTAMSDLGFPMGSQAVTDILVSCNLDADTGYIDFSAVDGELLRERKDLENQIVLQPTPVPSSFGAVDKPWRADIVHKDGILNGKQQELLKQFRENVQDIYNNFAHNRYSYDRVLTELAKFDIAPTKMFITALHKNRASGELSFEEFIRSLVIADSNTPKEERLMHSPAHKEAGALNDFDRQSIKTIKESDQGLFLHRRRTDPNKAWENRHRKEEVVKEKNKFVMEIDEDGQQTQRLKNSKAVKKAVYYEDAAPSLLSESQLNMQAGYLGADSSELSYNSEQKLMREQVLALLRKLDAGQMSMNAFQEKVFKSNFELPEAVVKELTLSLKNGFLDWRRCMSILDADVFKTRAFDERYTKGEVDEAEGALKRALIARGTTSIGDLATTYRHLRGSRGSNLSFNEFRQGLKEYGITDRQVDYDQARVLFHIYDTNGDGLLDIQEFIKGVCGNITARRLGLIRLAFFTMDRYMVGKLSLDSLVEKYQPSNHPDVVTGRMGARDAIKDMMYVFTSQRDDGMVVAEMFDDYFTQLSTFVESDDDFETFMRTAFSLDARAPPPSLRLNRGKGINGVEVPKSMQVHGDLITWNQEASAMENEQNRNRSAKRSIYHDFKKQNVKLFNGPKEKSDEKEAQIDEYRLIGGIARKNIGHRPTTSLLNWGANDHYTINPDAKPMCMRDFASQRIAHHDVAETGSFSPTPSRYRPSTSYSPQSPDHRPAYYTNVMKTLDSPKSVFEFHKPMYSTALEANVYEPVMKTTAAELPDTGYHMENSLRAMNKNFGGEIPYGIERDVPSLAVQYEIETRGTPRVKSHPVTSKSSRSLADTLAARRKNF
jgi:Ca2+-binding EF-hand superfamily protein